ncbi:FkbM family methyltransferase [Pseudoprimorskyibacter insulae]|uniref:Methyltransferase FkbM domain-containing protein n=1 Tax=Pseudoprimorskyibacter insulae TaxID=1695997 RepID=A0A2R8AXS1_9RHOB|nr:FkbM family methyltransferase [Pseudoprimorskyibacter insulae]SPF80674.1 hypothetical protein PRI8871_02485 [Pseudoprimorskyibacter insulae]
MSDQGSHIAQYLAEGLGPLRPMAIADVGANPIEAPKYLPLAEAGLAQVWGFEPNDDARAALNAQRPDWLTVSDKAIGLPGPAMFHAYKASEMSSVYPLSRAALGYLGHFLRHLGTETKIAMTLHALDEVAEVPPLDLLQVDTQGADRDVIAGARGKLANAVAVIVEMRFYGLYEGEPSLGELDAELRSQGFVLHKFLSQKARFLNNSQRDRLNVRAAGSQLIDGDAVYIRSLEDRAAWSDGQLAHLALIASLVLGSHDLCLLCLDELAHRGGPDLAAGYVDRLPARLKRMQEAAE